MGKEKKDVAFRKAFVCTEISVNNIINFPRRHPEKGEEVRLGFIVKCYPTVKYTFATTPTPALVSELTPPAHPIVRDFARHLKGQSRCTSQTCGA